MTNKSQHFVAVVVCGGVGARLWPMSRKLRPKPFIELTDGTTLMGKLLESLPSMGIDDVVIVTSKDQLSLCQAEIDKIDGIYPNTSIIVEPQGKGTAIALAVALRLVEHIYCKDSVCMMFPSDHLIEAKEQFSKAVKTAFEIAKTNKIAMLGIKPTHASTNFGYICREKTNDDWAAVEKFMEKPDLEKAQELISSGNAFWNCGLFCSTVDLMQQELETYEPELYKLVAKLDPKEIDKDAVWEITNKSYEPLPTIMIDHAVAERTKHGVVIPVDCGWSDLGSWEVWMKQIKADENNNRLTGKFICEDSSDIGVWSQGNRLIAVAGCDDIIVVDTDDALLITKAGASDAVRKIQSKLEKQNDKTSIFPSFEKRPWGNYRQLGSGPNWQSKKIEVESNKRLSLQSHEHRSEHWTVVEGVMTVTIDDKTFDLKANESCYIPLKSKHRMANHTDALVVLIEVQCGDYLGEDDIIRYEDDFGRS